jgi:hypothetical protein
MYLFLWFGLWLAVLTNSYAGTSCGPQTAMGRWVPENFYTPMSSRAAYFGDACATHDQCYATLGIDKTFCDAAFARQLRMACKVAFNGFIDDASRMACYGAASMYVASVRAFGDAYFDGAQQGAIAREWMSQQIAQQKQQVIKQGNIDGR